MSLHLPARRQPPIPKELTTSVKGLGRSLGFDLVAITTAEPFERDERAATDRVRTGLMDGLSWYTEERVHKANRPRLLLEDARSVISLAMSYLGQDAAVAAHDPAGRIARYARGDDYHDVIKARLKAFVGALPERAGRPVRTRTFVDDGPMNDRAAAARAGIGWFGKNTNILTPTHGSWVFLAQVVTDLELLPDSPLVKTCGKCVRCIDVCPTGAIVGPYVLDNRRCISYLTIELRGPIPRDMRPMIGDWVFGCDLCQDVCPVNRKAAPGGEPAFSQRHDFGAPALIPLLYMDEAAFRERFRKSPVKRTKRIGLLRNVCVALGNIGDAAAVPALVHALGDAAPLVRLHAVWALGKIGGRPAEAAIDAALDAERDPDVVREIELTIAELASAPTSA